MGGWGHREEKGDKNYYSVATGSENKQKNTVKYKIKSTVYHIRGRGQRYGKYLGNQNFLLAFSKQALWSREGKSSMFKRNKILTKEDSVIKFSSWNIPGKIKTDNDLNIRRKQTSSFTPASNHLHTTSSSYRCSSCAGH